jgi:eukaryotic-like serine/threonine-protein kinase
MSERRPAADKRFGRYVVLEQLGTGAMGAVYRARDESLGRDVAVKTIHAVGLVGHHAEIFQARFANEARAVASLSHPNVVALFDVGVADGIPFLVMELSAGRSLAQRLQERGPLAPEEARALCAQIASALGAAHSRGIVHRDVKPANILEAEPGTWKLADFGVAHIPDSSLTLTGQFLGSPAYAAPEALEEGAFGPASDVYGLGATLYEALAGEPPFGEGGLLTAGALAAGARPRDLGARCPALAPEFASVVMSTLARDPAARPGAAALADLARAPAPAAPIAAPRSRRAAAAFGVIALLLAGMALGTTMTDRAEDTPPRPALAPATVDPWAAAPAGPPPWAAARVDDRWDEGGEERRRVEKRRGKGERLGERDHARRWRKAREKLREGKLGEARKELSRLLERYPDDDEARALLEELER